MADLEMNYKKGIEQGLSIKAVVVINPGNPTGQVMSEENLKDVNVFTKCARS
jgi:alanine transaminase